MTLFGLSPLVFLLGAGGLAAGLGLLHLLRVRLRTVDVDTLLFFRLAGALQKPRVLPGRPARWLAFALALLAMLAAWLAVAEPRTGLDAPSRFVVVEPDLLDADGRAMQVEQLLGSGLGPRGAVFAATSPPVLLLAADEPRKVLRSRAAALRTSASPNGEVAALAEVADRRAATDEVLWVGARAPATAAPVVHVPVAKAPAAALRALRWWREPDGAWSLVLRGDGAGFAAELRAGAQSLANGLVPAGIAELRLGPVRLPAGVTEVQCVVVGANAPLAVPVPTRTPLRVHVDAAVAASFRIAFDAVLQADPELSVAPSASEADVVVATTDAGDDPRPRLVLTPGVGDGARLAVATDEAPVELSLRDQKRRSAAGLPPSTTAAVWVADAVQGGALVAASADAQRRRIQIVDWLLQPVTHADVPVLLSAALRALGDRPELPLAVAGQSLVVPACFPVPAVAGAVLPVHGGVPLQYARGPAAARGFEVQLPTPAELPRPLPVALASIGGDGGWLLWLLSLLVLLLVLDAVLFHRGRLP